VGMKGYFPEGEADHSPPSSAEVKECVELYLQSPNTPSWCGARLKHRDNFTFTFKVCVCYYPGICLERLRKTMKIFKKVGN
jgi:hypothetical protein